MRAVSGRSRYRYSQSPSPAPSFLEDDAFLEEKQQQQQQSRSRSRSRQRRRDWSPSLERSEEKKEEVKQSQSRSRSRSRSRSSRLPSPSPVPAAVAAGALDQDAVVADPVPVPIDDDFNDDLPETRARWGPPGVNKRAVASMTFDPDDNENQVKQQVDKAADAWGSDDSFEVCHTIREHYRNGGVDVSERDVLYYMQNVRAHSKEVEKRLLIRANRRILSELEQKCLFFKQKQPDGSEKIVPNTAGIKTWREQAKFQHKLIS